MRIAERNRLRAQRAERLARLRPAAPGEGAAPAAMAAESEPPAAPEVESDPTAAARAPGASDAAQDALEHFLRALTGGLAGVNPAPPAAAAVLPFQRPEPAAAAPASDLDRLPGAGPGLIWALEREGIACLADLAPLAPDALAARLGPIGRLVPAETWIATARAAVDGEDIKLDKQQVFDM